MIVIAKRGAPYNIQSPSNNNKGAFGVEIITRYLTIKEAFPFQQVILYPKGS